MNDIDLIIQYHPEECHEQIRSSSTYDLYQFPIMGKIIEAHFDDPKKIGEEFRTVQLPVRERKYAEQFKAVASDDFLRNIFLNERNAEIVVNLNKAPLMKQLIYLKRYFFDNLKEGVDKLLDYLHDLLMSLLSAAPGYLSTFRTFIANGLSILGFLLKRFVSSVLDWIKDGMQRLIAYLMGIEKQKIATVVELSTLPLKSMKDGFTKAAAFDEKMFLFNMYDIIRIPTDHELVQQMLGFADIVLVLEDIRRFYLAFPSTKQIVNTLLLEACEQIIIPHWSMVVNGLSVLPEKLPPIHPHIYESVLSTLTNRNTATIIRELDGEYPYVMCIKVVYELLHENPEEMVPLLFSTLVPFATQCLRANARSTQQISTSEMQSPLPPLLGLMDLSTDMVEFLTLHDKIQEMTGFAAETLIHSSLVDELKVLKEELPLQHTIPQLYETITRCQEKGRLLLLEEYDLQEEYLTFLRRIWRLVHLPKIFTNLYVDPKEEKEEEESFVGNDMKPGSSSSSSSSDEEKKDDVDDEEKISAFKKIMDIKPSQSNVIPIDPSLTSNLEKDVWNLVYSMKQLFEKEYIRQEDLSEQVTKFLKTFNLMVIFNSNDVQAVVQEHQRSYGPAEFAKLAFEQKIKPKFTNILLILRIITELFSNLIERWESSNPNNEMLKILYPDAFQQPEELRKLDSAIAYMNIYQDILKVYNSVLESIFDFMDDLKTFVESDLNIKRQYRDILSTRFYNDCKESPSLWEAMLIQSAGFESWQSMIDKPVEAKEILMKAPLVDQIVHLMSIRYVSHIAGYFNRKFITKIHAFVQKVEMNAGGFFDIIKEYQSNLIQDLRIGPSTSSSSSSSSSSTALIDQKLFGKQIRKIYSKTVTVVSTSNKFRLISGLKLFSQTENEFIREANNLNRLITNIMASMYEYAIMLEIIKYDDALLHIRNIALGSMVAMGLGILIVHYVSLPDMEFWNNLTADRTILDLGPDACLMNQLTSEVVNTSITNCTAYGDPTQEQLVAILKRYSPDLFSEKMAEAFNDFVAFLAASYGEFQNSMNPDERRLAAIYEWILNRTTPANPSTIRGIMQPQNYEFLGAMLDQFNHVNLTSVSTRGLNNPGILGWFTDQYNYLSNKYSPFRSTIQSDNPFLILLEKLKEQQVHFKVWKASYDRLSFLIGMKPYLEWLPAVPTVVVQVFQFLWTGLYDLFLKKPLQGVAILGRTFQNLSTELSFSGMGALALIAFQIPWLGLMSLAFSVIASTALQYGRRNEANIEASINKLWEGLYRLNPEINQSNPTLVNNVNVGRKPWQIWLRLFLDLLLKSAVVASGIISAGGLWASGVEILGHIQSVNYTALTLGALGTGVSVFGLGAFAAVSSGVGMFTFIPTILSMISTAKTASSNVIGMVANSERIATIRGYLNSDNILAFLKRGLESEEDLSSLIMGINPNDIKFFREVNQKIWIALQTNRSGDGRLHFNENDISNTVEFSKINENLTSISERHAVMVFNGSIVPTAGITALGPSSLKSYNIPEADLLRSLSGDYSFSAFLKAPFQPITYQ
jgi:hypothetical protein